MHTFDALALGDKICDFLISCGGPYKEINGEIQFNVMYALGSQQFIMREEDGEILYFVCWWRVQPEDVENVTERIRPIDLSHGSVLYITEAGNKLGPRGMAEIRKRIRAAAGGDAQGVFWHRPIKNDKILSFPHQKGKEA
jgi:hypothetical protein